MDIQTIKQTVEIIPLLGYELKRVGAYHVGACPFCNGMDRFTIKHTPTGDRWHCRQCGDGKYHTVIDFVMKRDPATSKPHCISWAVKPKSLSRSPQSDRDQSPSRYPIRHGKKKH